MAKTSSKPRSQDRRGHAKNRPPKDPGTPQNRQKDPKLLSQSKTRLKNSKFGRKISAQISKIQAERAQHIHLHRSLQRSYREDYLRPTKTPGLLSHAMLTFKTIFKHWGTFFSLALVMTFFYIILVGLMSEDVYQEVGRTIDDSGAELAAGKIGNFAKAGLILFSTFTTGGLDTAMDESGMAFMVVLFLIMWLVTIFLLRHFYAGENPKLRDGLYNALGPLLSTVVIFAIIFVQILPILLVVITYSAAVSTEFLSTPFYALLYFIFAALMFLLSGYLLSSSLMALIAVTSPGLYPVRALLAASDLIAGRRIRLVLRILYLVLVVALIYIVIMLPIILLDLWLKSIWTWLAGWPVVSFCLLITTCLVFIYATTYLYTYYRWLLDDQTQ